MLKVQVNNFYIGSNYFMIVQLISCDYVTQGPHFLLLIYFVFKKIKSYPTLFWLTTPSKGCLSGLIHCLLPLKFVFKLPV